MRGPARSGGLRRGAPHGGTPRFLVLACVVGYSRPAIGNSQ